MSIGAIGNCGGGYDSQYLTEMRQKLFTQMDQDGDGSISKSEFQAAAAKKAQETGQTIDTDKIFASIDTNQDGVIDKSESDAALTHMLHHRHQPPPEASGDLAGLVKQIFAALDTNKDGTVDQTEYDAAMKQIEAGLGGSTASTAAATGTADAATTATASTNAATDANGGNTLLALIQQLLQNILSNEKYQNNYASSQGQGTNQGQDTKSVNSYA